MSPGLLLLGTLTSKAFLLTLIFLFWKPRPFDALGIGLFHSCCFCFSPLKSGHVSFHSKTSVLLFIIYLYQNFKIFLLVPRASFALDRSRSFPQNQRRCSTGFSARVSSALPSFLYRCVWVCSMYICTFLCNVWLAVMRCSFSTDFPESACVVGS